MKNGGKWEEKSTRKKFLNGDYSLILPGNHKIINCFITNYEHTASG